MVVSCDQGGLGIGAAELVELFYDGHTGGLEGAQATPLGWGGVELLEIAKQMSEQRRRELVRIAKTLRDLDSEDAET